MRWRPTLSVLHHANPKRFSRGVIHRRRGGQESPEPTCRPKASRWASSKCRSSFLAFGISACLVSTSPRPSVAQESTVPSDETCPENCLLQSSGAAHFQMILGRLELDAPAHIKCSRHYESECGKYQQNLRVTAVRGIPSLHYRWSTPNHDITIDVEEAATVFIRSSVVSGGQTETLEVRQPPRGDLQFSLYSHIPGSETTPPSRFRSASFTHLRIQDAQIYQKHVRPVLQRLLHGDPPSCSPADLIAAAAQNIDDPSCNPESIATLVEEMGSKKRSIRASAESKLLAIGLPVLSVLGRLDLEQLDTEQRTRIERLYTQLRPHTVDNRGTLASWLAGDLDYWRRLAPSMTLSEREQAGPLVASLFHDSLPDVIQLADGQSKTLR